MAQISKGDTFTDGEQVTGARLNQLVDSSTLLAGAILDQGAMTANTVAATDSVLLYDLSATGLRKPTVSDILNSNLPVTTSAIAGGAGVDVVITPAATYKVDVAGAFEADSINATGNITVGGTLGGTSAIKIATGTTAERPASPVAGQLRFNTSTNALEVYSGTLWINGVTSGSATFDGTVNITGAIQYNSKPVWGIFEWVTSGYSYSGSGTLGGFTGSKYQSTAVQTKADTERWDINFSVAADFSSQTSLTSYTIKIIDSNSVVYASTTVSFVPAVDANDNIVDDYKRIVSISTTILPATVFSGVTLAVVVTANTSPTVSRVMPSPSTAYFGSTLASQYAFTASTNGIKYTTA